MSNQSTVRDYQYKYSTAAKFPPKLGLSQQNVAFATFPTVALQENGGLLLKLSFLVIILEENYEQNFLSDSDSAKERCFRGRDTATQRDLSTSAIF